MEELLIISYEVYVLERTGWQMHGRYPQDDRAEALTEAKGLEAEMAAAVKVVRSEYHPRGNTEERHEVYSSKLTPGENSRRPAAAEPSSKPKPPAPPKPKVSRPGRAKPTRTRRRRHVVHRRDMSPGAVLMRLVGIVGASALIATLITVSGGLFLDRMAMFHGPEAQSGRGLMSGVFLTAFLLVALPWVISFARQIEVIGFTLPGPGRSAAKRPPPPRPAAPSSSAGAARPVAAGNASPVEMPPPLLDDGEFEDDDEESDEDVAAAPIAGPMADGVATLAAGDFDDMSAESSELLLTHRRSLLRFLRSLATDLRESRPDLNSFERYGLGLLLAGAVDQMVEHGGLGRQGRAQLLREALGILGRQPGLIEAVEGGLDNTLSDPRSARMVQAGRDSMRHFLASSRDFLAAVMTALETWSRPNGVTGSGVVAAMLVQVWPDEAAALERAYAVARERGGAVIGSVDGIALLFPGIGRALPAALDLMPNLPVASRIGIEAAEAATEDEAVRAVGAARRLCHAARPGQILRATAVRARGGRAADVGFAPVEEPDDAGLPVYLLLPEPASLVNTTDPSPSSAADASPVASDPAG